MGCSPRAARCLSGTQTLWLQFLHHPLVAHSCLNSTTVSKMFQKLSEEQEFIARIAFVPDLDCTIFGIRSRSTVWPLGSIREKT